MDSRSKKYLQEVRELAVLKRDSQSDYLSCIGGIGSPASSPEDTTEALAEVV